MFDNITPEERQNSRRTDPAYLKANKAKFFHQQAQSETPLSNNSHATGTNITEANNSTSTGDSVFNSLWVVPIMIVLFLGCILLTNLVLGL